MTKENEKTNLQLQLEDIMDRLQEAQENVENLQNELRDLAEENGVWLPSEIC